MNKNYNKKKWKKNRTAVKLAKIILTEDKKQVLVDKLTEQVLEKVKENSKNKVQSIRDIVHSSVFAMQQRFADIFDKDELDDDVTIKETEQKLQARQKLNKILTKIKEGLINSLTGRAAANDTGKGIKDKDLMQDTGGQGKHCKTPTKKPPKEDERNRYKDKSLTKENRKDLAKDTINDPDMKKGNWMEKIAKSVALKELVSDFKDMYKSDFEDSAKEFDLDIPTADKAFRDIEKAINKDVSGFDFNENLSFLVEDLEDLINKINKDVMSVQVEDDEIRYNLTQFKGVCKAWVEEIIKDFKKQLVNELWIGGY